ncbi:MAG: hypothetical protein HQK53_07420, partial [Oligoflexia bacterium]|nr:hypothetical protein [Oligoflexia bacterium]
MRFGLVHLLVFLLSLLSLSAYGSNAFTDDAASLLLNANLDVNLKQFMPDNDLWMEDDHYKNFQPNVNQVMFNKIIQAGRDAYASNAPTINANWDDPTVNASTMKIFGMVTINMYGGLARRPEIIPEGFAIVL